MPDMRNAKAEFIDEVEGKSVLCAWVMYAPNDDETTYNLCMHYTTTEYDAFLQSLDFVYNAGFGGQELYGVIWYADGTWSERYVYDGEEEWVHRRVPVVPEYLKKTKP